MDDMEIMDTTVSMENTEQSLTQNEASPLGGWEETLAQEAVALQAIYPNFDLSQMMTDDTFKALVSGEVKPTLRQVYECLNPSLLVQEEVQARVKEQVEAAVASAVATAVEQAEKNLLAHIKARGMRPPENGRNASVGVRTHPAVHRLTREDRAKLALMAQRGETVQL